MKKTIETDTSAKATRAIRSITFAAVAAGALAAAFPQQASAFGLQDIFGAIEDVWEKGDNAVNSVGRSAADKARKIGRGELESTSTGPRQGRTVTGRGNASSGSALPPARGEASSNTVSSGSALPPPRKQNERVVVRVPQPGQSGCQSGNCNGHHHGHHHHNHH